MISSVIEPRSRGPKLWLIAIAAEARMSISRSGKAPRGFVVGRLLDTFDKEASGVSALQHGASSATPPASRCSGSGARIGIGHPKRLGDSSQISGGFDLLRVGYTTVASERLSDGSATTRRSVVGSRNGHGAQKPETHRKTSPGARSPGNCAAWSRR